MGKKIKAAAKKIVKGTEVRSWIVAVLCIAILIVIASYVSKLTPGSSAYTPGPVNVAPADGMLTPINKITFGAPIQITGNLTDPWEDEYHFSDLNSEEIPSDADGDNVVFVKVYSEGPYAGELFVYNITTKAMIQINSHPNLSGPYGDSNKARIWGDTVVYPAQGNIYMNKIIEGNEAVTVTNDVNLDPLCVAPNIDPDIYGNTIVWAHTDQCLGPYNLYIIDKNRIQDGPRRITWSSFDNVQPRIFDNVVVWEDYTKLEYPQVGWECNPNNPDARACREVHICDLKSLNECEGSEKSITDDTVPSLAYFPDIYGGRYGKVVWLDDVSYDWSWSNLGGRIKFDVFVFNVQTDEIKRTIVWEEGMGHPVYQPLALKELVSFFRDHNNGVDPKGFLYSISNGKEYDMGTRVTMSNPEMIIISAKDSILNRSSFNLFFSKRYPSRLDGDDVYLIKGQIIG